MKKEERILHALSDVKEEYIEEVTLEKTDTTEENIASQKTDGAKKVYWVRWGALAASVALIAFVGTLFPFGGFTRTDLGRPSSETESEDTSDLGVVDLKKDMGFSITTSAQSTMVYKVDQLVTKNPWNAKMEQLTFPVYENLAFVSIAGAPAYFSEEELLTRAKEIAQKISATPTEWKYKLIEEEGVEALGMPYMIVLQSDLAEIWVEGNGNARIAFYEGVELPEGYILSDESTYDDAQATVNYLIENYKGLHEMENPKGDCRIEYDLYGKRHIFYVAYDSKEGAEGVAEYCFDTIIFRGDENGKLKYIFFGDIRTAAKKLGEYPIITEETAKDKLLSGDYMSHLTEEDVVGGCFSEENIGKVELMYREATDCKYFQPYYCFYVAIEGYTEGVINYAHFYVPAVTDEYVDDFTQINHFGN